MKRVLLFDKGCFENVARLRQKWVRLGSSLNRTRFDAARSVWQARLGDPGAQTGLAEGKPSARRVAQALVEGADLIAGLS